MCLTPDRLGIGYSQAGTVGSYPKCHIINSTAVIRKGHIPLSCAQRLLYKGVNIMQNVVLFVTRIQAKRIVNTAKAYSAPRPSISLTTPRILNNNRLFLSRVTNRRPTSIISSVDTIEYVITLSTVLSCTIVLGSSKHEAYHSRHLEESSLIFAGNHRR